MNDKEQKPKRKLADRQAKDKREYERLVKKIEHSLKHRSPGVWDWIDDVIEEVDGWVEEGVESVNDFIDDYIWDTDLAEADLEGWVRDTFDIPDREGVGFVEEASNEVYEWVYDTGGEFGNWLRDAGEEIEGGIEDMVERAETIYRNTKETITRTTNTISERVGDIINKIDITMPSIDFSAFEALADLPLLISDLTIRIEKVFTFDIEEYQETMNAFRIAMPVTGEED